MMPLAPAEAGNQVAALFEQAASRLFDDLVQSGAIPGGLVERECARAEWDCYALFGCVRGIVAAGGFAPRTADTIDALHAAVFGGWDAGPGGATGEARRALLGRRYGEYETIAQAGGASGAADVAARLGAEAARHMFVDAPPPDDVVEILGSMHETLAEAVVSLLSGEGELRSGDAPLPPARAAIPGGIVTPPLAGAHEIVMRLSRAGITVALGGSGLLAALGLATSVHDWDLTTDAPREQVEAALAGIAWEHKGSDTLHADEKFMIPTLEVEVIRGFAFFTPAGIVRIPTSVTRSWAGLPVGSPECWATAYHLLSRVPQRNALLGWLARHGADHAALEALLAQPLPREMVELLRSIASPGGAA